jgi:hypothetical protein
MDQAVGLAILVALSTGCRDAVQPVVEPPAVQPPAITIGFPPLSRPGDIYVASEELAEELARDLGLEYRYVLYEDGSFALQSFCCRFIVHEIGGEYVRTDSLITFAFNDRENQGTWAASGVIRGDSLAVAYDAEMRGRGFGFIDGVYVRQPEAPWIDPGVPGHRSIGRIDPALRDRNAWAEDVVGGRHESVGMRFRREAPSG